jgi:hypothetical protein
VQWAGYVPGVIVPPKAVAAVLPCAPRRAIWWSGVGVITKAQGYRHLFAPWTSCMYDMVVVGAWYAIRHPPPE